MSDQARREALNQAINAELMQGRPLTFERGFISGAEWEASRPVSDEVVKALMPTYQALHPCSTGLKCEGCATDLELLLESFVAARREGYRKRYMIGFKRALKTCGYDVPGDLWQRLMDAYLDKHFNE